MLETGSSVYAAEESQRFAIWRYFSYFCANDLKQGIMTYCKNCGKALEEGANFCPECGTKVEITIPVPAPAGTTDNKREEKVKYWLISNASKLPESQIHIIRDRLMNMSDADFGRVTHVQFTDPTLMLIISIFFGMLGVDRFALGDIGLGLGKLLTCGGIYIWWLVDLFYIMDATKEKNFAKFNSALYI